MSLELEKEIGLFDVDSRELSEDGLELSFRPRVEPIIGQLDALYDFAYKHKLKLIFSTCCSGRFLQPDSLDYVLHIPLVGEDKSWLDKIDNYRYYYFAKRTYSNPRKNSEACLYDVFKHNHNGLELIKHLGVKKWVVFGNGFNFCVYNVCKHLLENKVSVIVLKDVVVQGIGLNKDTDLEAEKNKILEELSLAGAEILELQALINRYEVNG